MTALHTMFQANPILGTEPSHDSLVLQGLGEKKQEERELHHERCVGGMRKGTKEIWEVSATFSAKTTQ